MSLQLFISNAHKWLLIEITFHILRSRWKQTSSGFRTKTDKQENPNPTQPNQTHRTKQVTSSFPVGDETLSSVLWRQVLLTHTGVAKLWLMFSSSALGVVVVCFCLLNLWYCCNVCCTYKSLKQISLLPLLSFFLSLFVLLSQLFLFVCFVFIFFCF